jgi:hypothetical protein
MARVTSGAILEKDTEGNNFEEDNFDFTVSHPKLVSDSVVYVVKGADRIGKWEGTRRYSHFHALYEVLLIRFPACFIPKLPPKKALVSLI